MVKPHLVIVGPPGTGKTKTLAELTTGHQAEVRGSNVLFCSHTRAAAVEAVFRFGHSSGQLGARQMAVSTIHSFCFGQIGAGRAQTVDDIKLEPFVEDFGLDLTEGGDGRKYLEIISYSHNTLQDPTEVYDHRFDAPGTRAHFVSFVDSYVAWKKQYGYIDFCDMLERYLRVTRGTGLTLLAVDEGQDLTPLHWKVVRHIMRLNPDMQAMVAGDEDQCIYEYQGADHHGLHDFREDFAAAYRVLTQSYRVPRLVHSLAQRVINRVETRVPVTYEPRDAEGHLDQFPDSGTLSRNIRPGADSLILYADKFVREQVEEELQAELITYTAISGMPGPLDTKAGKALRAAAKIEVWPGTADADINVLALGNVIKAGLNDKGMQLFNSVGIEAVHKRLQHRDLSLVRAPRMHWDYLQNVDLAADFRCRISTIHGAKGMQAEDVHLCLGQSPAAMQYAMENPDAPHRLFYVGITRARERLTLYEADSNSYEVP